MEEAGFGRADVVVAVTGEDEDNLVICQMAKKLYNVKRVLARVNPATNSSSRSLASRPRSTAPASSTTSSGRPSSPTPWCRLSRLPAGRA